MSLERAVASLEREIALLAWHMGSIRMSPREHAIFCNRLAHPSSKPIYSLETRVEKLTQEIKHVREHTSRAYP